MIYALVLIAGALLVLWVLAAACVRELVHTPEEESDYA